ncbi:hypothetical protein [Kribbella swartbergensis]
MPGAGAAALDPGSFLPSGFLEKVLRPTDDRGMARYEVVARAKTQRLLSDADYLELALRSHAGS